MTKVTRTLKLKFHNLNKVKQQMFAEMTRENTRLANELLQIPYVERREITTAKIVTSLKSALANQTIRHTISATGRKVKHYKCLPPEINKQNWKLEKRGDTYSLSFPTIQGDKRVPIVIASVHWESVLEQTLAGDVEKGSVKLIYHRSRWYAYVSVTVDVPELQTLERVGVDRGQNNLAVVAPAQGFGKFHSGKEVMHRRRYFQKRRQQLQQAKKFRALKKWNNREQRWMEAVNHTISRRLVRFAQFHEADVVVEDLEGCRDTMKQSKNSRSDAGQSRHSWSFYSLEQKLEYKLALYGLKLVKVPAPYTSKSCSTCGTIGHRHKHDFNCRHGHYHNADLNAARNIAQWEGNSCSLELQQGAAVMVSSATENEPLGTARSSSCSPGNR
ncbi:MAG: IS200/IS605 family element transposase accessory protein TnpB [Coleofasciculus sp. C3-bin4]|nr:IS200/IS605 family element transposase accessory protein TnpB [Coleofasciculus sp. C3-bin4]